MKIGICANLSDFKKAESLGYDYLEIKLRDLVMMSEVEFLHAVENNFGSFRAERANMFFPNDILLVGDTVNYSQIKDFCEIALYRANKMGINIVVLGSGKSRSYKDNLTKELAEKEFIKVLEIVSVIAMKHNVIVAVEPLNRIDTNLCNTVVETFNLVQSVGSPYITIMADYFHMIKNGEEISSIKNLENKSNHCSIIHAHIANGETRSFPKLNDNNDYKLFLDTLRDIGYTGALSIEGSTDDLEADSIASLQYLRTL